MKRWLIVRFLWFTTSVPWGIPPSITNLADHADNRTVAAHFFLYSSGFISSFCFLCYFLLSVLLILLSRAILFYSSVCSLLCSMFPPSLFIHLISLIVFFSNLLSFLFSFPTTLFCLLLPSVLLLFNLFSFCYSSSFLSPLILLILFCSCFCFLLVRIL